MTYVVGDVNFPENLEYWEALEKNKLLIKRCSECKKPHHYPRAHCPFCGSDATAWEQSSGGGEIYSFTVLGYRTGPSCLAYVALVDGPTIMTNIVDCALDAIEIGAKVRVVFKRDVDGRPLPMFTLYNEINPNEVANAYRYTADQVNSKITNGQRLGRHRRPARFHEDFL